MLADVADVDEDAASPVPGESPPQALQQFLLSSETTKYVWRIWMTIGGGRAHLWSEKKLGIM